MFRSREKFLFNTIYGYVLGIFSSISNLRGKFRGVIFKDPYITIINIETISVI